MARTRRSTRKSRQRAQAARNARSLLVAPSRFSVPFPERRFVKLKYRWYGNFTAVTTNVSYNTFLANSLYDPDYTGTGNQPRYFDQLVSATLYKKYRVHFADFVVTFVNKSTTSDAVVGSFIRPTTTLPSTNADIWLSSELSDTQVTTLLPLGQSNSRRVLRGRVDCANIVSGSHLEYHASSQTDASYGSSPSDPVYITFMAGDDPVSAGGVNVDCFVEIVYFAELFSLARNVAQS